jgi:hypothetical protein
MCPSAAHSGALSSVLLFCMVMVGGYGGVDSAVAQDAVTVSFERQEARVGESIAVPIQVNRFNNIGAVSLIVTYDPEVLRFASGAETRALISGAPRENFSANVVEPGELRVSWFDLTGSSPINIRDGTLLTITFHRYAGGESAISFAEGSEISTIEADPVGARFRDGRVARRP